jgi:hypothetical protein
MLNGNKTGNKTFFYNFFPAENWGIFIGIALIGIFGYFLIVKALQVSKIICFKIKLNWKISNTNFSE